MPPAQTRDESFAVDREAHVERGVRVAGAKPQRALIVQALLAQKLEGLERTEIVYAAGEIPGVGQYGGTDCRRIALRIRSACGVAFVVEAQSGSEHFIRQRHRGQ